MKTKCMRSAAPKLVLALQNLSEALALSSLYFLSQPCSKQEPEPE